MDTITENPARWRSTSMGIIECLYDTHGLTTDEVAAALTLYRCDGGEPVGPPRPIVVATLAHLEGCGLIQKEDADDGGEPRWRLR